MTPSQPRRRHKESPVKIEVKCKKCDEWVDERKVETLDIEEDFCGRDVLTFKCNTCHTKQKSLRVGRR